MKASGTELSADNAASLRRVGEERVKEIDGVSLCYWELPRGPHYLVLLHGNSLCKEAFYHQFEGLAESDWSLLAIDLPGHGASADASDADRQYTIPGYADLVWKLLDALEIERPAVLGWSLGGNIALELAGRDADISGIMLVGTPPVGPGTQHFADAFQEKALTSPAMQGDAPAEAMLEFLEDAVGPLDPMPACFADAAIRADGRAREIMGAHWAAGTEGYDQMSVIAQWHAPIACMIGAEDALARIDFLENAHWRNLWNDQLCVLPGCGHAPFLHDPDRFNTLLHSFLDSLG